MGEPLTKYFQIFSNNLKIANFTRLPLSMADLETLVEPEKSLWRDTFIPIVVCVS